MEHDSWTLTARWIFPVSGPPLEGGTVTVRGPVLAAVEPEGSRSPDFDLGDVAVLPGLVNAHTHLDLTGLHGRVSYNGDFTDWLRTVIAFRVRRTADRVKDDIAEGLAQSIRHGVTLLADVAAEGGSWDALAASPVRAVVYREMLGLPRDRASRTWADYDNWARDHPATPTCRAGVSPHAPYSVRSSLFLAASTDGKPVTVHLAETLDEVELLGHRRGRFVKFLRELGVWAPDGLADDVGHVLQLLNGLSPTLIVHGNYLDPCAPFPANASLVYCPRTHAYFSHRPHPFRDFLARGVRVALGTDSLASNPDLDLLAEARFLRAQHADVPGSTLLRMATLDGAAALGWDDETGSLAPGKSADLVSVPVRGGASGDPHDLVLRSPAPVLDVLCRGRWLRGGPPGAASPAP